MKKVNSIVLLIFGIIGIWLVIDHIANFEYPDYFYNANPNITKYIGVNVVSWIADFSFFTYHTMILFSLWAMIFAIGELFKLDKISHFVRNNNLMTFIFVNYLITIILYTGFELASGKPTFGYYGPSKMSIYNLITNLIGHYLLFLVCLFAYIKIKPSTINNKIRPYILITSYLLIYMICTKLSGMYLYDIEWYPYIIFDREAIMNIVNISNNLLGSILTILVNIIIYIVYMTLYIFIKKKKERTLDLKEI